MRKLRILRVAIGIGILALFGSVTSSTAAASCNMITRLGDQTAMCQAGDMAAMPTGGMTGGATMTMPMGSGPFDEQFIDMMVPHHQMAVMMAQMALMHATHPELKQLATSIIASQSSEITAMKQWRAAWFGSDQTPSMDQMPMLAGMPEADMTAMSHMMADMQNLPSAVPFDRAFMQLMIPHHQSAVDAAKLELSHGQHPELKALAASIVSDQQREITEMQGWLMAWYGQ